MTEFKEILDKEDEAKRLPFRKYRKFSIFPLSGYKFTYWRFWRDTFSPVKYWRDVEAFYQRGTRGWADRDTWSLDCYLANFMGDALHYIQTNSHHENDVNSKGLEDFKRMIEAWDGIYHSTDMCNCIDEYIPEDYYKEPMFKDGKFNDERDTSWATKYYEEHYLIHHKKYSKGIGIFVRRMFSLWW